MLLSSRPDIADQHLSQQQECRKRAMDLLARREHSSRELAVKLQQRGFDADAVESTLESLSSEGLLSDARFAESFLNSRTRRGQGPVRIRAELMQRGVSSTVIQELLDDVRDWDRVAAEARVKKFGTSPPRDLADRARQSRFLTYRGFSSDQVRAAMALDPLELDSNCD